MSGKEEVEKEEDEEEFPVATRPLCETGCPRYQYPIVFHQPITIYYAHNIIILYSNIFIQPYAIDVLNSPHDGKNKH